MKRPATRDRYQDRINRVLAHVAAHLDEPLDLVQLADIACFSPYHFHRVFRAVTGLTVADLVRRLRLTRAAAQLRESTGPDITTIAFDAGYGSPDAFGHAFRQLFGTTPSAYRADPNSVLEPTIGPAVQVALGLSVSLIDQSEERIAMDVTVQSMPEMTVAAIRHVGPYQEVGPVFQHLMAWAGPAGVFGPDTKVVGLSYDDPKSVDASVLRYDAGVTVGADQTLPDGMHRLTLPAGKWAVYRLVGPYSEMPGAFARLYGEWMPTSGYEPADVPCMEIYHNSPQEVAPDQLVTDICIPLVPSD